MIDYNEYLDERDKIDCLIKKVDAEREKISWVLCNEPDLKRRLSALEDFYLSLKELNERYPKKAPEDKAKKTTDPLMTESGVEHSA